MSFSMGFKYLKVAKIEFMLVIQELLLKNNRKRLTFYLVKDLNSNLVSVQARRLALLVCVPQ